MSLVFPRSMTEGINWAFADFVMASRQEYASRASGRIQGKDLGPAIWHASFRTMPIPKLEARALQAEFDGVGGVTNAFYVHTADRTRPANFHLSNMSGQTVSNISYADNWIETTTLPRNLTLIPGDYLETTTASGVPHLHRAVWVEVMTGSRHRIHVAPALRADVGTGQALRLINPRMLARLVPESNKVKRVSGNLYNFSFDCIQDF